MHNLNQNIVYTKFLDNYIQIAGTSERLLFRIFYSLNRYISCKQFQNNGLCIHIHADIISEMSTKFQPENVDVGEWTWYYRWF